MNNISKSQHLKLYLRLKQQECIIESSLEAFLINSKVDPEIWHSIKRDIDKFEHERQKTEDSLKESVNHIHAELKSVKAMVNVKNVNKIDVEGVKTKLQSLWKKIEEFKNFCNNIDNLIGEENSLNANLGAMTRVIRKHKNLVSDDNPYCKTSNVKTQLQKEDSMKECDYDDIEDFCTLLAKTGHTGNWSEEDHLLFIKLRKKHKSIPNLVRAIQAKCPDLSKECIINHDAWYRAYLKLREKQKIAVREWRKRKETERLARLSRASESQKDELDISKIPNRLLKVAEHNKPEIERKKEMVRQWKERKVKERAEEEERLRNLIRAKREFREGRWQARAFRIKKLVAEYKEKKGLEKQEFSCSERRHSESSVMSALILQVFRARDQEFLQRRRSILVSKVNQSKQNDQPTPCYVSKMHESTLLKETKAWQEKLRNVEAKTAPSVCYIKDLPKRTMVSWKSYEVPGSLSYWQR